MPRYHIQTHPAPAPFESPAPFQMDETDSYVKYGHRVFPGTSQRGDRYWTAEIISQTWYQAETGRIPISGAGYGGPFSGEGFEGMWLDMSEIVRPTRDGIHGRETISTTVNLGGAPEMLEFDAADRLLTAHARIMSLPLPVVFGPLPMPLPGRGARRALSLAAERLGTLRHPDRRCARRSPSGHAWPCASRQTISIRWAIWLKSRSTSRSKMNPGRSNAGARRASDGRMRWSRCATRWARIAPPRSSGCFARACASFTCMPTTKDAIAPDARCPIHCAPFTRIWCNDAGATACRSWSAAASPLPSTCPRSSRAARMSSCSTTCPSSPGAARLWADKRTCPVEQREIDAEWGAQRLVNSMAAWRDQLLEALGAMGMREVRRLRGEVGRVILEETEAKAFRRLFPATAPLSSYRRLPEEDSGEGDMRWTHALLASTHQQARDGRPDGEQEFRVGGSGGGFDRLAFAFELTDAWQRVTRGETGGWLTRPVLI